MLIFVSFIFQACCRVSTQLAIGRDPVLRLLVMPLANARMSLMAFTDTSLLLWCKRWTELLSRSLLLRRMQGRNLRAYLRRHLLLQIQMMQLKILLFQILLLQILLLQPRQIEIMGLQVRLRSTR